MLRANAEDHPLADVRTQERGGGVVHPDGDGLRRALRLPVVSSWNTIVSAFPHQRAVEEVHGRGTDETGDEEIGGVLVKVYRRGHLLEPAVLHHGDPVAERHGLDLIVGYIDHRRAEAGVEPGDFGAHLEAGLGVKIREGLIEQEHPGLADEGAAKRNPLPLAAGERGGFAIEAGGEVEDLRGILDALGDLCPWKMPELQPEGHVVIDRHVGIKRVVLEYHRDIAVLGRKVIH